MDSYSTVNELLEENKYFLERPNRYWIIKIIVLTLVVVIGIYALILQIREGHLITGMRDNVVWGVYIVNFVFISNSFTLFLTFRFLFYA